MRPSRRPLLRAVALLLGASLLVAGCSEDEPAAKETPALSAEAIQTLVETGAMQLASGEREAAHATFTSVVEIDPDNVLAHYNLGLIAQEESDLDGAIEEYEAALAADPAYGPALYNKAILLEKSDLKEAVALYERAVEAQPDFAPTHMRLGFALVHLGRTKEGEDHLAKGLALDPSMKDVAAPDYD